MQSSSTETSNPYGGYLRGCDPLAKLAETPSELQRMIAPVSAAMQERALSPGKWSLRELLAHLADIEIALSWRFRQTLAEPGHTLQPFDQDKWSRNYAEYTAESGLQTFLTLRAWNLALLSNLSAADYATPVNHPEHGSWTMLTLMEFLAGHDIHHLERLPAMVQSLATG